MNLAKAGYLYFIASEAQTAIKIGFAENVYMRLKSLQTGNPDELRLLATIPCLAESEVRLHRIMKPKSLRLEWYPDDAEVETLIYELQDDMFDAGMETFDPPEGADEDEVSALLNAAYKAKPLPTELILQRVRECCREITEA
jgi:hypothetical protein